MGVILIVIGALVIGGVSIFYSKKDHNPVEELASEIIKKETGVDIDALLPPDK